MLGKKKKKSCGTVMNTIQSVSLAGGASGTYDQRVVPISINHKVLTSAKHKSEFAKNGFQFPAVHF